MNPVAVALRKWSTSVHIMWVQLYCPFSEVILFWLRYIRAWLITHYHAYWKYIPNVYNRYLRIPYLQRWSFPLFSQTSYKQQSFYVWVSHQRKPDQWADEQQRQIYCLDRASSCDLSSLSDFPLPRAPRSPPVKSETTSPSQPKVGLCSCVDIIQLALYSPTSCTNHFVGVVVVVLFLCGYTRRDPYGDH